MVFLRTHQPYSGTEVLMETKLEIRKNSRNIGKFAETRVHIVVSSNQ